MMKISKKTKAILNTLDYLVQRIPDSVLRFSAREVPHVVVNHKYSICWFAVAKEYRVWEGYATPQNRKIAVFKNKHEVVNFLKTLRGDQCQE